MTSLRQIESNRRNALKSTGPRTDAGKQRASRNAVRHGLTAETVISPLEEIEDYKAFEQAITIDYEAETAIERELVLRLASLLWRLRRATSIETGLFQIQNKILRERKKLPDHLAASTVHSFGQPEARASDGTDCVATGGAEPLQIRDARLDVATRFLHLASIDEGAFERLGRYETSLWRQARQTIFTLEALRWRVSGARNSSKHCRWQKLRMADVANLEE